MITSERLDDAVRRILGLKAKLNLHRKQADGTLLRRPEDLAVIGCEEHLRWRAEAADASITLVKNTLDQLPIRPRRPTGGSGCTTSTPRAGGIYESSKQCAGRTSRAELERRGFEVTVNDGLRPG